MRKKLLGITILFIFTLAIGIGLYLFFYKKSNSTLNQSFKSVFSNVLFKKSQNKSSFDSRFSLFDNSEQYSFELLMFEDKQKTILDTYPDLLNYGYKTVNIITSDEVPAIKYAKKGKNNEIINYMGYEVKPNGEELDIVIFINPEYVSHFSTTTNEELSEMAELMFFAAVSRENTRLKYDSGNDLASVDSSLTQARDFYKVFHYLYQDGLIRAENE